jgi:hypothetical protein
MYRMYSYILVSFLFFLGAMSYAYQQPLSAQGSSSRRIVVRESSKSISGSFPLYDLLSISTLSGSISVSVTPHSASSEDPSQPASLELKSLSGSVHANFLEALFEHHLDTNSPDSSEAPPPYSSVVQEADHENDAEYDTQAKQSGFPSRDYKVLVSTRSGSISGTFPLGATTGLDSGSGSIDNVELFVTPVNASGSRRLKTVSPSGSQSIRIVDDDFWGARKEAWWEGMVSRHESRSGSISVDYPDSWEGTIEVEADSGSVTVRGRGVEIIRDGGGRVVARKGKEGSAKVIVVARSGSVDLRFGYGRMQL